MQQTDRMLTLDPFGTLQLHTATNEAPVDVVPVRAFPLGSPRQYIALVDQQGHERLWIEDLDTLPSETANQIEAILAQRELIPRILRIRTVSSYATPSRWYLETDRGDAELLLKTEDDIRYLPSGALLITDKFGLHFLIPQQSELDHQSQRLLARFL
ncbi:MAG TPA: DUF1854 domain-containing protein [Halothiobacillus sp.]|nr:DUF1854 domain-containing protein [Halothiobacillus sp.]